MFETREAIAKRFSERAAAAGDPEPDIGSDFDAWDDWHDRWHPHTWDHYDECENCYDDYHQALDVASAT